MSGVARFQTTRIPFRELVSNELSYSTLRSTSQLVYSWVVLCVGLGLVKESQVSSAEVGICDPLEKSR